MSQEGGSKKKCFRVGEKAKFYNVGEGKSETVPVKGFIYRSNKKGRTITMAYAKSKINGCKLFRIVSNKKSSSKKACKKRTSSCRRK